MTMGGRPPKTITNPSFHPYAMASALLETMFMRTMSMRRTLALMSSCSWVGKAESLDVSAPEAFSGRSKKSVSFCIVSQPYKYEPFGNIIAYLT